MQAGSIRLIIMGVWLGLLVTGSERAHAQRLRDRIRQAIQNPANGKANAANFRSSLVPFVEDRSIPLDQQGTKDLVNPLVNAINARTGQQQPFRIAVFPFGFADNDPKKDGRISESSAGQAIELQGTLISTIRTELSRRTPQSFLILDKFALEREFKSTNVDPASISPDNPGLRDILAQLRIDAAVVGINRWANFQASVVFRQNQTPTAQFVSNLGVHDIEAPHTELMATRLGASLVCRAGGQADGAWIQVPIVTDKKNGPWGGELYALIPRGCQNSEYKIVVSNNGFQARDMSSYMGNIANPSEREESNRLFGVVVMVDGVNSFYEDIGLGPDQPGAVVVQPRDAKKWILGPRGYLIQARQNGSPYLVPTSGDRDHSALEVLGFQRNGQTADAFQFAGVGAEQGVVAESLGITDSIGLISILFFAEKLADDKQIGMQAAGAPGADPKAQLGTAAGRRLANPTIGVKVEFHKRPVHQIHLLYRMEDDCPVALDNRLFVQR